VLAAELRNYLDDGRRGERLRAGIAIAILGAPNVGKSSLLNWLAGREAAIVSTVAGTTRDVVEVQLDLAGYPVTLADTAGLRDSGDPIEREGVRRARFQAESADLTLPVFDATAPVPDPATAALVDGRAIAVLNKIDLLAGAALPALPFETHPVSVLTELGLEDLMERLAARVREGLEVAGSAPLVTRARHRAALETAAVELDRAATAAGPELVAEGLRLALRAFGRITGRVDVEELLDLIFREFCIGK
jgi:tRNA modification GTPase